MRGGVARLLGLALCGLAFGCSESTTLPARIDSVEPAFLHAGVGGEVTVVGEFPPGVVSTLAGSATVHEPNVGLGSSALDLASGVTSTQLVAMVPPTFSPGVYPLEVSFEDGRTSSVDFEIRDPISVTLEVPADVAAGEEADVQIHFDSAAQGPLDVTSVELASGDASLLTVVSPPPPPGTVPASGRVTVTARVRGADAATDGASVGLTATGLWEAGGLVGRPTGTATVSLVRAVLTLTLSSVPDFDLGQEVALSGEVTASGSVGVEALSVLAAPSGSVALSAGPSVAPVTLAPGETATLDASVVAQALGAGEVALTVSGRALRGVGPDPVDASFAFTVSEVVGASLELPAPIPLAEIGVPLTVEVRLRNDGSSGIEGVDVSADFAVGTVVPQSVPDVAAAAGGSTPISFQVTADASGALTFSGANGVSSDSGAPVPVDPLTVFVQIDPGPLTPGAPWIARAAAVAPDRIRVAYSTGVSGPADQPATYCIESFDRDPVACTSVAVVSSVQQLPQAPEVYELLLAAPLAGGDYTVVVDGTGIMAGGLELTDPRHAEFEVGGPLRVTAARRLDDFNIQVVFSGFFDTGLNTSGSAVCNSAATCAQRYRIVGPSDLGAITLASEEGTALGDTVQLTHTIATEPGVYTVMVANGRDGDGFDNATFAVKDSSGTRSVAAAPGDRTVFLGDDPVQQLEDGPALTDPFGDAGTTVPSDYAYLFTYAGRLYFGPSGDGTASLRMFGDGSAPELVWFRLPKDLDGGGTQSVNGASPPFPSIGFPGCAQDTHECGPNNEDARGLFHAGQLGGKEWLTIAGGGTNKVNYVYMTDDRDTRIDFRYVDMNSSTDNDQRVAMSADTVGGRLYVGIAGDGTSSPQLMSFQNAPELSESAVAANGGDGWSIAGNGTGNGGCVLASHPVCNLDADEMPATSGGNLLDFVLNAFGRVHLGNEMGVGRATVASPLDYGRSPTDWKDITPTNPEYAAHMSWTDISNYNALEPRDLAWGGAAVFGGRLFLGRNTVDGPQFWRCDPGADTVTAGNDPSQCDATEWTLIAADAGGITRMGRAGNDRISLVIASADHLYVGFDNLTDGVALYRTESPGASGAIDYTGQDDACTANVATCQGLGGNGFGSATRGQFLDAEIVPFGLDDWLNLLVKTPTTVELFRMQL